VRLRRETAAPLSKFLTTPLQNFEVSACRERATRARAACASIARAAASVLTFVQT
jgi:hypothetical protein